VCIKYDEGGRKRRREKEEAEEGTKSGN